tara:strand:- start:4651 stop:5718 length:1068 start_codon:yes stop_codon:yes gene_type:complete
MSKTYSIIKGSGRYIPERVVPNRDFLHNEFFYDYDEPIKDKTNAEVIKKFEEITGIKERRYVGDEFVASDIGGFAAENALRGYDREKLDVIFFAHNFGDVRAENKRSDFVPSLAARVKNHLGIKNPRTLAYDLPFGCPGWLGAMILSDYMIKGQGAKRILVIGGETLSRVSDPHDRDSMLYSDGAGAVVLEAVESDEPVGIISHVSQSDTLKQAYLLQMGASYNPDYEGDELFLKMKGRTLFKYAVKNVHGVVRESLVNAGLNLGDIKKVLLHQANGRMDEVILKEVYKGEEIPENVMPMTISWLGNSSIATLPTLYDFIIKGDLDNHKLEREDNVIFGSVGAGMNINSVVYRMP